MTSEPEIVERGGERYYVVAKTCQFCGASLQLEIHESYVWLNDPFGILPLACCDNCASLRERRRGLVYAFNRAVLKSLCGPPLSDEAKGRISGVLERLVHKWITLAAEWHHTPFEAPFEAAMVDRIMQNPDRVKAVLAEIWIAR